MAKKGTKIWVFTTLPFAKLAHLIDAAALFFQIIKPKLCLCYGEEIGFQQTGVVSQLKLDK